MTPHCRMARFRLSTKWKLDNSICHARRSIAMPDTSLDWLPSEASYTLVVALMSSEACAAPMVSAWMGGSNTLRCGMGAGLPAMSRGSYSRYDHGTVFAVAHRGSRKIPFTPTHGAFDPNITVSASLER